MPAPGAPVPLLGRWLRVCFAEQRRPLDAQDAETGVVYCGPPGYAAARAAARASEVQATGATGGVAVADMTVAEALMVAGGDQMHATGAGFVDALTVRARASAAVRRDTPGCTGSGDGAAVATAPASASRAPRTGRITCPLCLLPFGRGRGLRMHLIADSTGRGHGLSGDLLAVTVAAAEAMDAGGGGGGGGSGGGGGGGGGGVGGGGGGESSRAHAPTGSGGGGNTAKARSSKARQLDAGIVAARDGDIVALRAAVDRGWDASTIDKNGACALHWAAGAGHLAVCQYLVTECGVDVAAATTKGRRDCRNALHWAARNGHTAVCEWLVGQGLAVDSPTKDGTTAFHWAVWQRHIGTAKFLVASGANPVAVNSFGCTAAHWAALSGSVATCRWIASLGVPMDSVNVQGHSALHKAAFKGYEDVALWLLDGDTGAVAGSCEVADALDEEAKGTSGCEQASPAAGSSGAATPSQRAAGRPGRAVAGAEPESSGMMLSAAQLAGMDDVYSVAAMARLAGHFELGSLLEERVRTRAVPPP